MNTDINTYMDAIYNWLNSENSVISLVFSVIFFITQLSFHRFIKWMNAPVPEAEPVKFSDFGARIYDLLTLCSEDEWTHFNGGTISHTVADVWIGSDKTIQICNTYVEKHMNAGELKLICALAKELHAKLVEKHKQVKLDEMKNKVDNAIFNSCTKQAEKEVEQAYPKMYMAVDEADVIS